MGLMKKLTSGIVASSLVFGLVGTAFAGYGPDAAQTAGERMRALGVIQGRGDGDLALNADITRAELVRVFVTAFGQGKTAELLKGAAAYSDTATHWASGDIALAKNLAESRGFQLGLPDGRFNPNGKVTAAEAIAFIMKFLGVKPDGTGTGANWADDYINGAVKAGLLSADDKAVLSPIKNNAATRGLVFYLADQAFYGYKLPEGGTVYTKLDTVAPTIKIDNEAASTTTAASVTVTGSVDADVVAVYVGSTANKATLSGGKFEAKVNLELNKENTVTVFAVDRAGNTAEKSIKVTRTAGAAAAIKAADSLTVTVGEAVELDAVVVDKDGNALANATIDVESTLGEVKDNKFVAGTNAGEETITLSYGELKKEVKLTVKAGKLAKLNISPATVDLNAGGSQKFTAEGADEFGNKVELPGSVTWSASKGIIGADGSFGATQDAAGSVTITAKVGDVSGTATANVFGAPAKIQVAAVNGLIANGESKQQLVATITDANGNVARNFNGTVRFVNNNSNIVTLSSNTATAVNGVATVELTAGTTVGTAVISVSASGVTGATATVTTAAQTLTSIELKADPATVAADSQSKVTVTATGLDQAGVAMKNYSGSQVEVVLTSSDTSVVGPSSKTLTLALNNGKLTATDSFVAGNNLGAATLSATVKVGGTVSSTITANSLSVNTALVGVPYKLAIDPIADAKTTGNSGTTQNVVVRVLDVNGNQVTGAASAGGAYTITNVVLTHNGTAGKINVPANNAITFDNGKATIAVTNTKAESVTYTVTAKYNGVDLVKAEATGKFVPGAAAKVALSSNPSVIAANGVATATLTAKITDAADNPVTDGTYAVTFKRTAGTTMANWAETTVNTVNGVATTTVTAGSNLGTDSFKASVTFPGNTVATDSNVATVQATIIGIANQLKFGTITPAKAGDESVVNVEVKDANDILVSYDNNTIVTLEVVDANSATQTYTATAANGVATFKLSPSVAGTYTLKATATGLKGATGATGANANGMLTIAPNTAKALKLSSNVTTLAADAASQATITVALADKNGNTTTDGTLAGLELTNNASGVGVLATKAGSTALDITYSKWDATAGAWVAAASAAEAQKATIVFKAGTTPGTATITAKATGLTDATLSLNTQVVGAPAKLALEVDGTKKATVDTTKNLQKVTVTVLDANGNRVTNSLVRVKLTADKAVKIYTDSTGATEAAQQDLALTNAGQVSFYVTHEKAETVTYTAKAYKVETDAQGNPVETELTSIAKATGSGSFTNNVATNVSVAAAPTFVKGDGSNITVVTATIVDAKGNKVTDATGTVKFQIPAASGLTHAFISGAASDGWYTASVSNGQAIAIVQTRSVTSSTWVSVEADYYKDGATTVTIDAAPTANVFYVADNTDSTAPSATSAPGAFSTVGGTGADKDNDVLTITSAEVLANVTFGSITKATGSTATATGAASVQRTGDGTFKITLNGTLSTGDKVSVTVVDAAGNSAVLEYTK